MNENSDILLESGTNELEILEFTIAGKSFGINVAKVLELMQRQEPQLIPHAHRCIEGIFQPREEVYTILDLAKYLDLPASEDASKDIYIISNFNQICLAFHVHTVENIHRISWEAIEELDDIVYGGQDGIINGIAKIEGRIISILDFEKITYDVAPSTGVQPQETTVTRQFSFNKPLLVAEDSMLLRKLILETLNQAGYSNVILTTNGAEAWKLLSEMKEQTSDIRSEVCCVITDIEMPQMDGHHLTKLIKTDPQLSRLPVIIFSSLINEQMQLKGEEVGADAQLSKPEISKLIAVLDSIVKDL